MDELDKDSDLAVVLNIIEGNITAIMYGQYNQ